MKIRSIAFFMILFAGCALLTTAQFLPEELAKRGEWEAYLAAAEVTASEQMGGSQAVTNPWVIDLQKDGIQNKAIWKNPSGRMKGFTENWKWEIAAYRLDKMLGLHMVPPTVERRYRGDRGSCQLWIDGTITLKQKVKDKIKTPPRRVFYWNRALYLQRAFDNLIANEDRHQNQYLITDDFRMILIDHSRSFRTTRKFTRNLIYTKKHREGPREMKQLPRAFWEKLKALDFASIREAVGEYLTDKEIEAVLLRRDLIVKEVIERIEEHGEDKVLY
jgi:hypothetical protein